MDIKSHARLSVEMDKQFIPHYVVDVITYHTEIEVNPCHLKGTGGELNPNN